MALATLMVLMVSAVVVRHRPTPIAIAALLGSALMWPFPWHGFEGPVLLPLSPEHGVHVSDLLSVAAFALACAVVVRQRRARLWAVRRWTRSMGGTGTPTATFGLRGVS
jgi:hypothetical protein